MNIIKISKQKNHIIKKDNELIKAKGKLSSTSQKMLAMLISMIRVDDSDFQRYALSIEDYKKVVGSNSYNFNFLKEQAKELMKNPFELKNGNIFNWCSKISTKEKPGFIIFDIHPDLKPYLLKLKENFTQYQLINILQLKGKYSQRLYELFIMKYNEFNHYHHNVNYYKFELNLNELTLFLGIPKSYRYDNIKNRILLKAQNDFKKYTNIVFTFSEIKQSKKIKSIIIELKDNSNNNSYLNNLSNFIKYIRQNYINKEILKFKDKYNNDEVLLSVGNDGKLYNKYDLKQIDKKRSLEIWKTIFELAKKNSNLFNIQNFNCL